MVCFRMSLGGVENTALYLLRHPLRTVTLSFCFCSCSHHTISATRDSRLATCHLPLAIALALRHTTSAPLLSCLR
jgi:hypothetical protein